MSIFVYLLVGVLGIIFGKWVAKRKQNKDSMQVATRRAQPVEPEIKGAGGRYRQDSDEPDTLAPGANRGADVAQSNQTKAQVFTYTLVGGSSTPERDSDCGVHASAGQTRQDDDRGQGSCSAGDSGVTSSESSSGSTSYDSNP